MHSWGWNQGAKSNSNIKPFLRSILWLFISALNKILCWTSCRKKKEEENAEKLCAPVPTIQLKIQLYAAPQKSEWQLAPKMYVQQPTLNNLTKRHCRRLFAFGNVDMSTQQSWSFGICTKHHAVTRRLSASPAFTLTGRQAGISHRII